MSGPVVVRLHMIPRHGERTRWEDEELRAAAEQRASGMSLADVAAGYRIDAQTVADHVRRAGIPIRHRRGRPSHSGLERGPGTA